MKNILIAISLLGLTGCVCLNPAHHQKLPPSAQTEKVIESLKTLKTDLDQAGEESTGVDQKLERALTLAEKLSTLLDQLETLFNDGKSTVKPQQ